MGSPLQISDKNSENKIKKAMEIFSQKICRLESTLLMNKINTHTENKWCEKLPD